MIIHYRLVDTENVQFVVRKYRNKKIRAVLIDFYYHDTEYSSANYCTSEDDMNLFFDEVNEEDCMEVYYSTISSLN